MAKTRSQREKTERAAGAAQKKGSDGWEEAPVWAKILRLARAKFLVYSLACHLVGVAYGASQQGMSVDWYLFGLLQATVWVTHIMTHFWNEHADVEVDKMNQNATSWTGGSKVLAKGWLPTWVAAACGSVTFVIAFAAGIMTVWRFLSLRPGLIPEEVMAADGMAEFVTLLSPRLIFSLMASEQFPWQFVLLGWSVLVVAIAYSLPPLHLAANGLGELAVSYVLTFATPGVGLLIQGGSIDLAFIQSLVPFFIVSSVRMMVMNIPDRLGDEKGGKVTSVVIVGEERAVSIHNAMTLLTYAVVLPQVPMPSVMRLFYCVPLPFRWWQSLRLNSPKWWTKQDELADSIPFVESLFVLATAASLCVGLLFFSENTIVPAAANLSALIA